jgi:hypothetical protein
MAGRAAADDERVLRAEAESAAPPLSESEIEGIVREVTDEEVQVSPAAGARACLSTRVCVCATCLRGVGTEPSS